MTARSRARSSRVEKVFGQIIVRADLEPHDAVGLLAARSQHEHGDIAGLADLLEDLEAIHAGEHQVEDHGLPRLARGALDALRAGVNGGDIVAERFRDSRQ